MAFTPTCFFFRGCFGLWVEVTDLRGDQNPFPFSLDDTLRAPGRTEIFTTANLVFCRLALAVLFQKSGSRGAL